MRFFSTAIFIFFLASNANHARAEDDRDEQHRKQFQLFRDGFENATLKCVSQRGDGWPKFWSLNNAQIKSLQKTHQPFFKAVWDSDSNQGSEAKKGTSFIAFEELKTCTVPLTATNTRTEQQWLIAKNKFVQAKAKLAREGYVTLPKALAKRMKSIEVPSNDLQKNCPASVRRHKEALEAFHENYEKQIKDAVDNCAKMAFPALP